MEAVVGMHTVYELARAFLNPDLIPFGQKNFEIVRDLEPLYSEPVDFMLPQELDNFISGRRIQPLLADHNLRFAQLEVTRLASGALLETGRTFIAKREAEIHANFPGMCAGFIAQVDEVRTISPETFKLLRTFEDVLEKFETDVPSLIEKILRGLATPSEAKGLAKKLGSYPALRASVRANLYVTSVCITTKRRPGFDKLDDNRHAIDAAYFNALVTNDKQLANNAPKIAPGLETLSWEDIAP